MLAMLYNAVRCCAILCKRCHRPFGKGFEGQDERFGFTTGCIFKAGDGLVFVSLGSLRSYSDLGTNARMCVSYLDKVR